MAGKPHGGQPTQGSISSNLWGSPPTGPCSSTLYELLPIVLSRSPYSGYASYLGGLGAPESIENYIPRVGTQISLCPMAQTIHPGGISWPAHAHCREPSLCLHLQCISPACSLTQAGTAEVLRLTRAQVAPTCSEILHPACLTFDSWIL